MTLILSQIDSGDPSAAGKLLPLVYEELRKLAAAKLAFEKPGLTLQATALVHEAYLRLVGTPQAGGDSESGGWEGRGHFFAAAAEAMRRILVENARRKGRIKHGGELRRQELTESSVVVPEFHEDLLALDEALDRLKAVNPQAVKLIHLRFFAGLSLEDAAAMLDISPRSAGRLWAYGRAWLHQEITDESSSARENAGTLENREIVG